MNSFLLRLITLLDAGGGGWGVGIRPLYHINVVPQKNAKKICQFFVTFSKYANGVLETTFSVKYYLV